MATTEIPVADAALRLRQSYQVVLNMVLRGELSGRRDERGRWRVDLASLDALTNGRTSGAQPPRPVS